MGLTAYLRTPRATSLPLFQRLCLLLVVAGVSFPGGVAAAQGTSPLTASWQAVGPLRVASAAYGNVTGRVSSVAIDPGDPSGNTVYLGTTGGGVWKSVNAAGAAGSVTFVPLTDTLPVYSLNAGSAVTPSLTIGAVSVQSGVVLAGTGDPNDATDSYYGGGILRSVDGGVTWTLVQQSQDGATGSHSFKGLAFAGFAWSSTVPGLVVAAVSQSAEGTLVNAADSIYSVMGLYYSTDAGVTWQMSVVMDGSQTVQAPQPTGANLGGNAATAVVWNPVRQRFYAAIRYHGYYQSADGVTWTRLSAQPGTGMSLTACPTNPRGLGSATCPIFRGALAVQPVTGDTFALSVDRNNLDQGLWQDVCAISGGNCTSAAATFAKRLVSTPLEVGASNAAIAQGDYNLALAAAAVVTNSSPDTLLYVGTEDVFRCSLAAGCVLRNTTNAVNGCAAPAHVAPGQHAIAAMATSGQPLIYVGNDSGLWRSLDGINQQATPCSADDATHFDNLNHGLGSLAEVVSLAQHPTDPNTLLAGLGANGTAATSGLTAGGAWGQLASGEGGTVAIDPSNPSLWYVSTAAGVSIRQCPNGGNCAAADFSGPPTIGSTQVQGDVSLFDAPWLLDPVLPSEVIVGTCRVWRGPAGSGAGWSGANAISRMLGGAQNAACGVANPVIRSLAAGGSASGAMSAQNAGSQVLYAGMAGALDGGGALGGHIFSTQVGGVANTTTAWTDLALSPVANDVADQGHFNVGGFDVSSVVADTHDATGATVYATIMGFAGNGVNVPHVYRSTDGGAHWTNISSNLPNVSANSLAVDPNDANTVYVGIDTGIYVTTQVASCSMMNCWSIYGSGLPTTPVTQLAVAASMPTGDGRTGELRAGTYGRGVWQIPLLTAASVAQPAMSLQPASLTFGSQAVGTISPSQTITVTNSGSAALVVSQVVATGDFQETNSCTSSSIAVGERCTVQINFLPSTTGVRTGVLTVYGNVAGGQATAALSGTAVAGAAIVLTPVTLSFPATTINASSAAQNITVSNTGGTTTSLGIPTATGDFVISANTCGASLAAGVGCTLSIVFRPTASGSRTGSLSITDDAGTQSAALSGTGTSPATDTLAPLSLVFGTQQLNTSSVAQTVTLANSGDVALTLVAAQITAGDYSVVNSCGNSLNAHSTCSMSVLFQPRSVGQIAGTLIVSDQYRSQTVTLNGTGVAPPGVSLSPTSTAVFPATGVGLSAGPQLVTLTNNGGLPLSIQGVAVTGDFTVIAGSNLCGSMLAVNASCTLQLAFTPTVAGARNGTLTVTDDAPNSPQTLSLSGTGVDFTLAPDGSTTATVASGANAVYPLLLSSSAGVPGSAVFTCTGAPANSTCVVMPATVALGTTTVVSVTVDTGVTTSSSLRKDGNRSLRGDEAMLALIVTMPLGWLGLRRSRRSLGVRLLSVMVICTLGLIAGCGAGRLIPNSSGGTSSGSPLTPAGTYTVVVTGTAAGLSRSVSLTLVVQ